VPDRTHDCWDLPFATLAMAMLARVGFLVGRFVLLSGKSLP
jgi:hypothetical protein